MCILIKKEAVPIFYGKRAKEEEIETVLVNTEIYSCIAEACIGWMRKDFVADDLLCPMCGNEMLQEMRELPQI
ncbi:cold-shock protein [Neobacillus drentensis]|uniref:cold-shock protein n=1 Tax=Bacillaceae TaxID=186817 RepID=UPI0021B38FD6|nr:MULTISPECIES: cold-shock protein [Bacillaceae]WHY65299.1 cold-shock protein [Neobacillus sp. SuZ13]